jgi:uncharacterized 2Fe-2S/4Fe-4S cluster protein (DUF4445 family)
MKLKVSFMPGGREVEVEGGATLLEAARFAGVSIDSDCGGRGSCGKCRVSALEGVLPLTPLEKKLLTAREMEEGARLACQARARDPVRVTLPTAATSIYHILEEGVSRSVRLQPAIQKYFLPMSKDDWKKKGSLAGTIQESLGRVGVKRPRLDVSALQSLARLEPGGGEGLTALVCGRDVLGFEPGDTSRRLWGLAVDIGTTTVVGYLIDLTCGRVTAVEAALNEQQIHGADVITRIDHALHKPDGLECLRELVMSTINGILERLCERQSLSCRDIYSVVIVGNTTINQLFWAIPPRLLIRPPYNPVSIEGLSVPARGLGITINPLGMVFSIPLVSGFIGSDTVGMVLATGLHKSKTPRIALDIGTNGEIVLSDGRRMVACSCAAGPAFEGAHIQCGMRGCSGAIDQVSFNKGEVTYHVIDQAPIRGICGSGLVDAIAGLLAEKLVTPGGRLLTREEAPGSLYVACRSEEPCNQFVLTPKKLPPGSRQVVITQKDIREVQLAKGAMLAGVRILLEALGLGAKDVREVYLAGAFGNYVRPRSALAIGLLPPFPLATIRQVGNAAGSGAKMALLSSTAFEEARRIAARIEYIDLALAPGFQEQFVKGMAFPS